MDWKHIENQRIAFLGAGIIAGVFIKRLLAVGAVSADQILATDIRTERLEELKRCYGIRTSGSNTEGVQFGSLIFIAVPPNVVKPVLSEIRSFVCSDQLIVSLAAAVPTWAMEDIVQTRVPMVRVIPNTPSLVGEGMNPHCLGRYVTSDHLPLVVEMLQLFGETIRVEERLMNAATALTAVGPTYILPVIKALKDVAMSKGLSGNDAQFATAQLVSGTGQLVLQTREDPDALKLMIGTRTLKEEEAAATFVAAFETAFEKIASSEKKLCP